MTQARINIKVKILQIFIATISNASALTYAQRLFIYILF